MGTYEPIAYTLDGELFCALHGQELEQAVKDNCPDDEPCDECSLSAFHSWDDLNPVEYCSCGHSFCGSCGDELSHDSKRGSFWYCSNCSTSSVFTDNNESTWVDSFERTTDYVKVSVPMPGQQFPVTVEQIIDESCTVEPQTFACYWDLSPADGLVLVLADSFEQAYETAVEYFTEKVEPADESELSDLRAGVQCVTVPLDKMTFTSKR